MEFLFDFSSISNGGWCRRDASSSYYLLLLTNEYTSVNIT